jgi:hypothetical protein
VIIVNVECKGETKKISLNQKQTVEEANKICRAKFKFQNTEGFCLHLAFPMSSLLKDDVELLKYKLKFNVSFDLHAKQTPAATKKTHRAL